MMNKLVLQILLSLGLLCSGGQVFCQQQVKIEDYRFTLLLPDGFKQQPTDTIVQQPVELSYFNERENIYIVVTARKSRFTDIKSYLDCTKESLERDLQRYREDTTLRVIECRASKYYPDKTTVLHFTTRTMYDRLNRCLIYFIHHRDAEIQVSFIYDDKRVQESLGIADTIMHSLKLY